MVSNWLCHLLRHQHKENPMASSEWEPLVFAVYDALGLRRPMVNDHPWMLPGMVAQRVSQNFYGNEAADAELFALDAKLYQEGLLNE